MNRLFLLLLLSVLVCREASAQNWRTVNPQDTVYFKSEQSYWPVDGSDSSGYHLRVVLTDSVRLAGGDSAFYFFKSLRYTGGCWDTLAPSWLGIRMVRKIDGTEFYKNVFGDTIKLETNAGPGNSWVLAKDTAGRTFQGTVASFGVDTINGVADSVKTISIQAYQNNIPVVHYYNDKILELSKNHGWVKTLDLYQFPNILPVPVYGAIYDSTQHSRLDKQFFEIPLDTAFCDWYATTPGNEWIHTIESGVPVGKKVVDSLIVARQVLASSVIAVTAKVTIYELFFTPLSSGGYTSHTNVQTHHTIDTVVLTNTLFHLMPDPALPEVAERASGYSLMVRYRVGSLCNDKFRFLGHAVVAPGSVLAPWMGCLYYHPQATSLVADNETSIAPLGEFSFDHVMSAGPAGHGGFTDYESRYYNYIKIDTCTWGTKIDVAALGVQQITAPLELITVSPNPAIDIVHINLPETAARLAVYDIMGRVVHSEELSAGANTLSVGDLPAGIYLLRFSGSSVNYTYKLIKN